MGALSLVRARLTLVVALQAGCSGGTSRTEVAVEDAGATLPAEVGFFDVPGQPSAAAYPARLFYVFQPANAEPARKPLVVLFNGGPGLATAVGLLAYGTGRQTLDPTSTGAPVLMANPASWTSFANLLYVDARQAGFSYGLGASAVPDCTFSEVEDASDFVRALLDFLDGHPALRANPVIIAGESYGGTRATWMLDMLLRYSTEGLRGGLDLPRRIQAHYDAVFPDRAGTLVEEAMAARQFGAQVLIEPYVLGPSQDAAQTALIGNDPYVGYSVERGGVASNDPDDVRKPPQYSEGLEARAVAALSNARAAHDLLGVDLAGIPLLQPVARLTAFHSVYLRNASAEANANRGLTALFGALRPPDRYFGLVGQECTGGWSPSDASGQAFIENLRTVRTFITHARYDANVYAPAIPSALQSMNLGVVVNSEPRLGVARPGWFRVDVPAQQDGGAAAKNVEVRFPSYNESGHMVAVTQAADLASDVQTWMQSF